MSDLITSTSFLIRQLCPINHVNNYNRCIYIYTKCVDALERVYILDPNAISEGQLSVHCCQIKHEVAVQRQTYIKSVAKRMNPNRTKLLRDTFGDVAAFLLLIASLVMTTPQKCEIYHHDCDFTRISYVICLFVCLLFFVCSIYAEMSDFFFRNACIS